MCLRYNTSLLYTTGGRGPCITSSAVPRYPPLFVIGAFDSSIVQVTSDSNYLFVSSKCITLLCNTGNFGYYFFMCNGGYSLRTSFYYFMCIRSMVNCVLGVTQYIFVFKVLLHCIVLHILLCYTTK